MGTLSKEFLLEFIEEFPNTRVFGRPKAKSIPQP
jgi:hypothetical protein